MKKVGIDVGYGLTKVYIGPPTPPIIFPSVIGLAEALRYEGNIISDQKYNGIHLILDEGGRFIGDLAINQSRTKWSARDRDRSGILTLILGALSQIKLNDGDEIELITGLPVEWYKQDKSLLIEKLNGEHTIHLSDSDPYKIKIIKTLVVMQPFGSYFYRLFDSKTPPDPDIEFGRSKIGVIDIGTYTTDYIIADQGQLFEPGSSSITTGMAKVFDLLRSAIRNKHRIDPTTREVEAAVKTGKIKIRGIDTEIDNELDEILIAVSNEIEGEIASRWAGNDHSLDLIIVAGGGASNIGPYLIDRFPQIEILEKSHITNVIGYYRYLQFKTSFEPVFVKPIKTHTQQLNGVK